MDKFYPPNFIGYFPLANGKPAAGGYLIACRTGTDVLAPVYDENGTLIPASRVPIDSAGRAHFLLDPTITYRIKVIPPPDVDPINTAVYDNVSVAEGVGFENPMTNAGDLIVQTPNGPEALHCGDAGKVLTAVDDGEGGTKPEYADPDHKVSVDATDQTNDGAGYLFDKIATEAPLARTIGITGLVRRVLIKIQSIVGGTNVEAGKSLQADGNGGTQWDDTNASNIKAGNIGDILTSEDDGNGNTHTAWKAGDELFIPLAGTANDKPVTGNVVVQNANIRLVRDINSWVSDYHSEIGYSQIALYSASSTRNMLMGASSLSGKNDDISGRPRVYLSSQYLKFSSDDTSYGSLYKDYLDIRAAGNNSVKVSPSSIELNENYGDFTKIGYRYFEIYDGIFTNGSLIKFDGYTYNTYVRIDMEREARFWVKKWGIDADDFVRINKLIVGNSGHDADTPLTGTFYSTSTGAKGDDQLITAKAAEDLASSATGDHKSLVSSADTTPDYLGAKVRGGTGVDVAPNGAGDALVVKLTDPYFEPIPRAGFFMNFKFAQNESANANSIVWSMPLKRGQTIKGAMVQLRTPESPLAYRTTPVFEWSIFRFPNGDSYGNGKLVAHSDGAATWKATGNASFLYANATEAYTVGDSTYQTIVIFFRLASGYQQDANNSATWNLDVQMTAPEYTGILDPTETPTANMVFRDNTCTATEQNYRNSWYRSYCNNTCCSGLPSASGAAPNSNPNNDPYPVLFADLTKTTDANGYFTRNGMPGVPFPWVCFSAEGF